MGIGKSYLTTEVIYIKARKKRLEVGEKRKKTKSNKSKLIKAKARKKAACRSNKK